MRPGPSTALIDFADKAAGPHVWIPINQEELASLYTWLAGTITTPTGGEAFDLPTLLVPSGYKPDSDSQPLLSNLHTVYAGAHPWNVVIAVAMTDTDQERAAAAGWAPFAFAVGVTDDKAIRFCTTAESTARVQLAWITPDGQLISGTPSQLATSIHFSGEMPSVYVAVGTRLLPAEVLKEVEEDGDETITICARDYFGTQGGYRLDLMLGGVAQTIEQLVNGPDA
jgi:hypothetical protein